MEKVIKETHSSLEIFQAISHTLTALTDLRYRIPSIFPSYAPHIKNPKGYYMLSDLSERVSISNYKYLLAEKLRDGREAPQLLDVFEELNHGISINIEGCALAKYAIVKYIKSPKWTTSEISNIIHPLYEKVTIEYLNSKGVRCAHEVYVKLPRKYRTDNMIERSETFKNNIEQFQNIISIPGSIKLISVDYTYIADFKTLEEKFDKFYQSKDRMLIIVLMGQSEKHIANFRKKLQQATAEDDGSRHLEHVKILTSKEYGVFLGFDGHHAKTFDLYQKLAFSVFSSRRLLFDATLQHNLVARQLEALNEDWINTYLRQS